MRMAHAPLGISRRQHVAGDGVRTGVAVVSPPEGYARTLVVCLGYAAAADAFELQRFTLLAHEWDARLVVVENPGYGVVATRLRRAERWALFAHADFRLLGRRILEAANSAVQGDRVDGVVGYSLGASVATGVVSAHRESGAPALGSVTLVEPVGAQRWSARALTGAMRAEEPLVEPFLAQTAALAGTIAPTDRTPGSPPNAQFVPDMLLAANALRAGRLGSDLARGLAGRSTRVLVVHGVDSHLSSGQACADIVRRCRERGVRVADLPVAGSHGLWHSLPAVHLLALQVRGAAGWVP